MDVFKTDIFRKHMILALMAVTFVFITSF